MLAPLAYPANTKSIAHTDLGSGERMHRVPPRKGARLDPIARHFVDVGLSPSGFCIRGFCLRLER